MVKESKKDAFKRRGYSLPLKDLLPDLAQNIGQKRVHGDIILIMNWRHIVGDEFADIMLPLGIKRVGGKPLLVGACDSGAGLLVRYGEAQICERINRYFGYVAVAGISIKPMSKIQ